MSAGLARLSCSYTCPLALSLSAVRKASSAGFGPCIYVACGMFDRSFDDGVNLHSLAYYFLAGLVLLAFAFALWWLFIFNSGMTVKP